MLLAICESKRLKLKAADVRNHPNLEPNCRTPGQETSLEQETLTASVTDTHRSRNPEGDVVARGHYSANLEWVEAFSIVLPKFDHVLKHVFASHFNLEAAWQAHQQAQHPPKEGEPANTETVLEADVTPGFRV
jgi:hypothetical protein